MKVKKYTILAATIETGNPVPLDLIVQYKQDGPAVSPATDDLYPHYLWIKNGTGAPLEYLLLANDKEIAEYAKEVASPGAHPYYDFTPLANGAELNGPVPLTKRIIIHKVSGTAGSNLIIYGQLVRRRR